MKIKINAGAVASMIWVLCWFITITSTIGNDKHVPKPGERNGAEDLLIITILIVPPVVFGYMWGKDEV